MAPAALPLADEPVAKDRNEQTCRSFEESLPAEIAGFRRLSSEELGELMENNATAVGGPQALRDPKLPASSSRPSAPRRILWSSTNPRRRAMSRSWSVWGCLPGVL